jgi:hypothetical protein
MKIRAITLFADIGLPLDEAQIARLGEFAHIARQAYQDDGFTVQTIRLATHTSPTLCLSDWADRPVEFVVALEQMCRSYGFEYVSLGPAGRDMWQALPELLAATESVFVTVSITDQVTSTIDGDAIWGAARVIR